MVSRDHHSLLTELVGPVYFACDRLGFYRTQHANAISFVCKWHKQSLKASQKPQVIQSNLFSQEGSCLSLCELPFLKEYFSAEGVCQAANEAGLKYLGGATVKIQVSVKFKLIQSTSAVVPHVFSPRKLLGTLLGPKS